VVEIEIKRGVGHQCHRCGAPLPFLLKLPHYGWSGKKTLGWRVVGICEICDSGVNRYGGLLAFLAFNDGKIPLERSPEFFNLVQEFVKRLGNLDQELEDIDLEDEIEAYNRGVYDSRPDSYR
jgi:hypothetical protein